MENNVYWCIFTVYFTLHKFKSNSFTATAKCCSLIQNMDICRYSSVAPCIYMECTKLVNFATAKLHFFKSLLGLHILIKVPAAYTTLKEIWKWMFLLYDLILHAFLWFLKCIWVYGPLLLCKFGWFLEAVLLKRPVVKEQSEELAAAASTCAWGSGQDWRVLYLIPIWASLWTHWCSIYSHLAPPCPNNYPSLPTWLSGLTLAVSPGCGLDGCFLDPGWSWLPSLSLIRILAYWLGFLASFQGGCCPCLPCGAQLLSRLLQGNLSLLLTDRAKGKDSQNSLNPTMCIILPKFLLFVTVTQLPNLCACKWPWSCMNKYLWAFMFSLFPASHV